MADPSEAAIKFVTKHNFRLIVKSSGRSTTPGSLLIHMGGSYCSSESNTGTYFSGQGFLTATPRENSSTALFAIATRGDMFSPVELGTVLEKRYGWS
jgi:hypothetical protein